MKITRTRIAARRSIIFQTAMIVLSPTALVGLISFFWKKELITLIPSWLIFITIFIQPFLVVFIVIYRLKKDHDGKLLRKWRNKSKERFYRIKSERQDVISEIKHEGYYTIEKIVPNLNHAFLFEITFYQKVIERAMLDISLNGVNLPLEIIKGENNNQKVLCHAGKAITGDLERLVFISGKSLEYSINNPYFIKGEIHPNSIVWQCEGNSSEKNIFLDGKCFPYVNPVTIYPFILLINGEKIGEYNGRYLPNKKFIALNIGNVSKKFCTGKLCILKPTFKHTNIILPHPKVFFKNKKVISDVMFQ